MYFLQDTQEQHISHGRTGRYESYSSPATCKPDSISLRSTYQQVFLAEDGREASKVDVSPVPLTPSGFPDSSTVLVLTRFDVVTFHVRYSKFFN